MPTIAPLKAFEDNYIWIILDENSPTFSCVDPGEATPVLNFAQKKQLILTHILLTHHHSDHIGGVEELLTAFPECQVFGPDDSRIPHKQVAHPITISGLNFEILKTPGHTSTHISYYVPELGWLFTGDTLFSAGCGRVFDGTMAQLHNAINLYKALPDDTLVFCGHEYTRQNLAFAHFVEPNNADVQTHQQFLSVDPNLCSLPSNIKQEKLINPFFRTDIPAVQQFASGQGIREMSSLAVFSALREAKNIFK